MYNLVVTFLFNKVYCISIQFILNFWKNLSTTPLTSPDSPVKPRLPCQALTPLASPDTDSPGLWKVNGDREKVMERIESMRSQKLYPHPLEDCTEDCNTSLRVSGPDTLTRKYRSQIEHHMISGFVISILESLH